MARGSPPPETGQKGIYNIIDGKSLTPILQPATRGSTRGVLSEHIVFLLVFQKKKKVVKLLQQEQEFSPRCGG